MVQAFQNHPDARLRQVGLSSSDAECINFALHAKHITPGHYRRRHKAGIKVVESFFFTCCVNIVIVINFVLLMMSYDGSSADYRHGLEVANSLLVALFVGEAVTKTIILTPRGYFGDKWQVNREFPNQEGA